MEFQSARKFDRYEVRAPAVVRQATGNGVKHHLLLTRDISEGGAYFNTMEPRAYSGRVQIELLLEVTGNDNEVNYTYMTVNGEVVRHDDMGIAVSFKGDSKLTTFHVN